MTEEDFKGFRQSFHASLHPDSIKVLKEKKEFKKIIFTKIYSSHQKRAIETAQILFADNFEVLDFIHENIIPKMLESKTKEEVKKFWDSLHGESYDPEWSYDGSESFNQIITRVNKLVDLLVERHQEEDIVAIVGHGVFFKHLVGILLAQDKYNPPMMIDLLRFISLDNGGYFLLDVNLKKKKGKLLEIKR